MSACEECQGSLGGCLGSSATPCAKCTKLMCSTCAGKYPLIPFDASKPNSEANDIMGLQIQSYCKKCFQETSLLDFSRTYDIVEAKGGTTTDPITLVIVHGAGASRALYRPHAEELAEKGYRSILLDLPGHASLNDTELTLDACVDTVKSVLKECSLICDKGTTKTSQGGKIIYMGCSLGAYIGFYILSKLTFVFSGAVLVDCGQNVGPDASVKARAGLWFLRKVTNHMSNKSLMDAMLGVTKKSKADYKLVETSFGVGNFFDQGPAHCDCLQSVRPADYIPHYPFPVLFFNGAEDYHDSEDRWLELCQNQELSSLKSYEGGDHFFSHDLRFKDDMLKRIDTFASKI